MQKVHTQSAFTCSKLTIKTPLGVVPVSLLLALNKSMANQNFKSKVSQYERRFKSINFDIEKYVSNVSTRPFLTVNTLEDPNDQLGTFNHLLLPAINGNVPLKRVKLPRPPTP